MGKTQVVQGRDKPEAQIIELDGTVVGKVIAKDLDGIERVMQGVNYLEAHAGCTLEVINPPANGNLPTIFIRPVLRKNTLRTPEGIRKILQGIFTDPRPQTIGAAVQFMQ